MREHRFDTLTRTAADAVSRRASVLAFAGAALATAMHAAPVTDAAQNSGTKRLKKKLTKVKQQFQQACDAEPGQCQAAVNAFCAQVNGEAECLEALSPCCELITDCDVGPAFPCVFSAFT